MEIKSFVKILVIPKQFSFLNLYSNGNIKSYLKNINYLIIKNVLEYLKVEDKLDN